MAPIQGAVGLAADNLVLILALPIVYGLKIPTLKKIGLCIVFLKGGFCVPPCSARLALADIE